MNDSRLLLFKQENFSSDWLGSCVSMGRVRIDMKRIGNKFMNMPRLQSAFAGLVLLLGVLSSSAVTITYDFGGSSGSSFAGSSTPLIQAVFTDSGLPANTVQLTLSAVNLSAAEFVSSWYFNLNPNLDPAQLSFSSSSSGFAGPHVSTGINAFKAGNGGKYDILFGLNQLHEGQSLTFTITGIFGLTAYDFDCVGARGGGHGSYTASAHVEGGRNLWIDPDSVTRELDIPTRGVPDASATILLLSGAFVVVFLLRKKLQSA